MTNSGIFLSRSYVCKEMKLTGRKGGSFSVKFNGKTNGLSLNMN